MALQQIAGPSVSFFVEDGVNAVPSRFVGMAFLGHHSNSEALTNSKP